jgi:hypothetical protein
MLVPLELPRFRTAGRALRRPAALGKGESSRGPVHAHRDDAPIGYELP